MDNNSIFDLIELYRNPFAREILSPTFYTKNRSEQERLIKKVPQLLTKEVDIETVIDTTRNYYFLSVDYLVTQLKKHVDERVIAKQDEEGGFPLVDRDYLIEIRGKDYQTSIDKYLKGYQNKFGKGDKKSEQNYKKINMFHVGP